MEKKKRRDNHGSLPAILRRPGGPALPRRLPTAERMREVERQLVSDIPRKHDIVGMFANMDKDLDLVDERLRKTIDHNRDVVLNAMKGKLYNIQKEIRELEAKTEKEAIRRRIDEEVRMLTNDIDQIRLESGKLEDRRRTVDSQLKKLDEDNKLIEDEERFLTQQIERNVSLRANVVGARKTQNTLTERIEQLEAPPAHHVADKSNDASSVPQARADDTAANMSQLSVSAIGPCLPPIQIAGTEEKKGGESKDYSAVRYRYEKRIHLLEKQIEELKLDCGSSSVRGCRRQVRSTNPVEEAFEDAVMRIKGEVVRRRAFRDRSLKISQSQPSIDVTLGRKDVSVPTVLGESTADTGLGLDGLTETDKTY